MSPNRAPAKRASLSKTALSAEVDVRQYGTGQVDVEAVLAAGAALGIGRDTGRDIGCSRMPARQGGECRGCRRPYADGAVSSLHDRTAQVAADGVGHGPPLRGMRLGRRLQLPQRGAVYVDVRSGQAADGTLVHLGDVWLHPR